MFQQQKSWEWQLCGLSDSGNTSLLIALWSMVDLRVPTCRWHVHGQRVSRVLASRCILGIPSFYFLNIATCISGPVSYHGLDTENPFHACCTSMFTVQKRRKWTKRTSSTGWRDVSLFGAQPFRFFRSDDLANGVSVLALTRTHQRRSAFHRLP